MNTPFSNNLQKDDVVVDAATKRLGKVAWTPVCLSRRVGVIWQGTTSAQYVDVMGLRLCVNGVAEEVPPVDGEPPNPAVKTPRSPLVAPGTLTPPPGLVALKTERDYIATEMRSLEQRFKELRTSKERLDRAIEILTAPA